MNETPGSMDKRKDWLFLLVFFLFTIASIVFSVLCLAGTGIAFLYKHYVLFSVFAALLLCVICGVCVWFTLTGKESWKKAGVSLYIFILFCLILLFILQRTGFFLIISDSDSLQNYLETTGVWMPILYIVLQYLQVTILPIPSVVSTVAGVALFGPLRTMLYSLFGIILGSFTAYFIGKKLGYKAVVWMIGEETLSKWQQKMKGKDNLFLTIMFIFPLFPDDVLCFVAGLSSMSTRYFAVMMIFSRILAIGTTCYSIDLIPFNTWWGLLIWGILIIGIAIVFVVLYRNMNKIQATLKKWKEKRKKKK